MNDKHITICGGKGTDVVPDKCHSLNPDLGTWNQIEMENERKLAASSSLYGDGDDMLVSGGKTENLTLLKDTEIVGEGKPPSSPSSPPSPVTVVSEVSHSEKWNASKLLSWSNVERYDEGNYWLANYDEGEFTLDLGGSAGPLNMVVLVNTHNAHKKNWGTREFKVFLSDTSDGPWVEVVHQTLEDSRQQADPLPAQTFSFTERSASFVRFEIIMVWGSGGGLQYFDVKHSGEFMLTLHWSHLKLFPNN